MTDASAEKTAEKWAELRTKYPVQNPDTPARTVDGTAIVITPHDSQLHTLNETATFIWDRADGTRTLGEITAALLLEFDVDEGTAREDAAAFVTTAVEKGLLVLQDLAGAP